MVDATPIRPGIVPQPEPHPEESARVFIVGIFHDAARRVIFSTEPEDGDDLPRLPQCEVRDERHADLAMAQLAELAGGAGPQALRPASPLSWGKPIVFRGGIVCPEPAHFVPAILEVELLAEALNERLRWVAGAAELTPYLGGRASAVQFALLRAVQEIIWRPHKLEERPSC